MSTPTTLAPEIAMRGALRATLALSLFALLLFVAALWGFRLTGLRVLQSLDDSVGEVLMKEGMRCEAAGAPALAKAKYEMALAGRFEGPQNRVFSTGRLGVILWEEKNFEAALPLLEKAASSPWVKAEIFDAHCDTLIKSERYPEAEAALKRWSALLGAEGAALERAKVKYYAALLAAIAGRREEMRTLFAEGHAIFPDGRDAIESAARDLRTMGFGCIFQRVE